jgi:hypothetical protein
MGAIREIINSCLFFFAIFVFFAEKLYSYFVSLVFLCG